MNCPADHAHAENATCYHGHGCRCTDCREGARQRMANRRRQQAYGRWQEPYVDATGSRRRIRGLQAIGWRLEDIAQHTGFRLKRLHEIANAQKVTPRVAGEVERAARVLLAKGSGPSTITARRAKAAGWVSIMAWDDEIDDPNATPADVIATGDDVDEVRVWNAVNGPARHHRLTTAERHEAVRILWARKWTDRKIAEQIGCHERTVCRIRSDNGWAAFDYADLEKAA